MQTPKPPTLEQVFAGRRKVMGTIPTAVEKLSRVDSTMVYEHLRSRAYAMPDQVPALAEGTRTLIYMAAALAGPSPACVRAITEKARVQGILREAIMETVVPVRFAIATRIPGDVAPIFAALTQSAA
ncbi:MAG: carboxymuconolactone decarboxylase [Planctomycetes bacterium]|nr:carboxymuconolactone decarboxylase [Planctomycetota bacterium]